MNTLKNREEAFAAVKEQGNRLGWYGYIGYRGHWDRQGEYGFKQTHPVGLPGIEVPKGYEAGSAYARVFATKRADHRIEVSPFYTRVGNQLQRVEEIPEVFTWGISIGAERTFDMDTAIFEQVEISDLTQPDEQTLKTLSKWITRISEVIDQK